METGEMEKILGRLEERMEERDRTIFNEIKDLKNRMFGQGGLTDQMAKHEACYRTVNGNGQPGLIKIVEDHGKKLERHDAILKVVLVIVSGAAGSSGTMLAQQIFHFI